VTKALVGRSFFFFFFFFGARQLNNHGQLFLGGFGSIMWCLGAFRLRLFVNSHFLLFGIDTNEHPKNRNVVVGPQVISCIGLD
jgi:hypothetical protein